MGLGAGMLQPQSVTKTMFENFEFEKKLNMFPPDDKKNKKKVYHFDEDEFDEHDEL